MFFILLFFSSFLFGGWNEKYNNTTSYLINHFPAFNCDSFKNHNSKLLYYQKNLLNDAKFKLEIKNLNHLEKEIFFQNEFVVKKRRKNNISDAITWELAFLLEVPHIVVPSYPVEVNNKRFIIQRKVDFITSSEPFEILHPNITSRITLEEYWLAHLFAFIAGASDLQAKNIGIEKNHILFFDNEAITVDLVPFKRRMSPCFYVPFKSVAFDWPHYRMPIGDSLSKKLESYASRLFASKSLIEAYCKKRKRTHYLPQILERINIISQFKFVKESTFRDFLFFLYPEMSVGMDELNVIVSEILKREVGDGISLFFSNSEHCHELPEFEQNKLANWRNIHIKERVEHETNI